jgi:hypothetical protein
LVIHVRSMSNLDFGVYLQAVYVALAGLGRICIVALYETTKPNNVSIVVELLRAVADQV